MIRALARSAFLLSGIAGLTFEIVWMRHLGRAVGATTIAVAITTAAYMGGLALGSAIGGKLADRLRRPLALYGALEIALALVGLAVPWLCGLIPMVDEGLLSDAASGTSRSLVRFAVAAAVLVLPTTAMGMTLPVLARVVTRRMGQVGREVGILYAINLLGAMLGAALAGFVLIPSLGLSATNLTAVGLDLLLGTTALVAGLVLDRAVVPVEPAASAQPVVRAGARPLLAMLLVTGAAAMALQVLWTRGLGTALGPSTYAFSAIVCAYLAGLGIGGAVAAWLSEQVVAVRVALGVVLACTGAFTLLGIGLVDDLPIMLQQVVLDESLTMGGLVRTEFALAALSVLPATIGMGAIFPLALSAIVGSDARVGAAVGRAYAFNTLGNIAGSFGAVFLLLPLFGVEWGMRVAALSYLVLAAALAWRAVSISPRWRRLLLGASAAVLAAGLLWPSWDIPKWTSGMFRMSMTRSWYPKGGFEAPEKLVFHRDGLASTVTVEEEDGVRWIKVDGKIDGSSEGDMPTQILSGLLPMIFHPAPRDVVVIGCGSGVTVGAALTAGPERITLVELERQVIEGARLFEAVNHAPWNDPRVTVMEDDGRNFLVRRRAAHDVIISEPSNPWMAGAASLFTVEFFRSAERRLEPGGVFLQWLQIYELAPERIASMLKTFQTVFPHVIVFTPQADSNDLMLMGSREPWQLDWQRLARRFEEVRPEAARAGVHDVFELAALMLFTDQEIRALPDRIELNTDDNALIEFGAPRDLLVFAEEDPELSVIANSVGKHPEMLRRLTTPTADWPMHAAGLTRAYLRNGMLKDAAAAARQVLSAADAGAEAAARVRELVEIAALFEEQEDREIVIDGATSTVDPEYARLADLVRRGDEEAALAAMQARPELGRRSGAHALLLGYLAYRDGQHERGREALLEAKSAADLDGFRATVFYYLAKASFAEGEYARAADEMAAYRSTQIEIARTAN